MGTFISYYGDMEIQEDKKEEFSERIMTILREGGMMEIERVYLFGEEIYLLDSLNFNEDGKCIFDYSYMNDEMSEEGCFEKETCELVTEKVGFELFNLVSQCAYLLYEFYNKEMAVSGANGMVFGKYYFIGWLNYLFDEEYTNARVSDVWKIQECMWLAEEKDGFYDFELCIYKDNFRQMEDLVEYDQTSVMSFVSTLYVARGKDAFLPYLSGGEKEGLIADYILHHIMHTHERVQNMINVMEGDKKEKFKTLVNMICWNDKDKYTYFGATQEGMENDFALALITMTPQVLLKEICDVLEMDFWEEWKKIRSRIQSTSVFSLGETFEYEPAEKVSTIEFLSPYRNEFTYDDFIWSEKDLSRFSPALLNWFNTLKEDWERIMNENRIPTKKYTKQLFMILYEINQEYRYLFAFRSMFYEFIENSYRKEYQAFLQLIEEVFEKCKNMTDLEQGPRNEPRTIMKRLLALLGNKELRIQVFGI